jgi:phospholipase/carboxylesterase
MSERILQLAGLETVAVGDPKAELALVLLHGYAMQPADLAPFARSIGLPALFLFPTGPHESPLGGRAWWQVDLNSREAALSIGPRDLFDEQPSGLANARHQLNRFLETVTGEFGPRRIVLGGFSQGGMLSLDTVLRGTTDVDALVLMSASRLALKDWEPHRERLRELPVFVSHGETDRDLAFAAGERLRDFVLESAASVTWVPFPGGHEIPLVVWRGLRKFLTSLIK